MPPESDILTRFERWFSSACNGDWEHRNGVRIESLDNPGWSIRVDLAGLEAEDRQFDRVELNRSEIDWVVAWVDRGESEFNVACGPENLAEAISLFCDWIDS